MTNKPTVVSTFAGCGGSSLGYHMAGFQELLALDFDKNAVATFALNFPDVPVWERDIKDVTGAEIMKFLRIKQGELDVLDGSPPCQGFSTSGKRRVSDSRNDLFNEFIRLVKEIEPKVFVAENVSGMVRGGMRGRFNQILRDMRALNYNVSVKLMNAKYYDVPQARGRVIFIGVRKDIGVPSFPIPNARVIPLGKALEGVVPKSFITLDKSWFTFDLWTRMRPGDTGEKHHPKMVGSAFNLVKVSPSLPCPSIQKTISIGNTRYGAHLHWSEPRTLSIEELKRAASFPDDFKFIGTFEDQWARIGNAVMPNMMKAIAMHVRTEILEKAEKTV